MNEMKTFGEKVSDAALICVVILGILLAAFFLNSGTKTSAAIGPTINGALYTPGQTVTNALLYVDSRLGSSSSNTMSNTINGVMTFCYPQLLTNILAGATQFVCMVAIPIQGIHHLSLQFTVQPITGNTNIGATNCVWEIVKSVSGGAVFNPSGTNGAAGLAYGAPGNTFYDVLGYVSNTFAAGSNFSTTIATYSDVPRTVATANLSTDTGIAGVPMLYIYSVTIAPQTGISNYFVVGNGD